MYTAVSAGPQQLARDLSARLIMHLFMKRRFKFLKKERKKINQVSAADRCLLSLVQLAKARVNDTQVIEITCKPQQVFQVCVSAADRPPMHGFSVEYVHWIQGGRLK